jgi:hypothetical protein
MHARIGGGLLQETVSPMGDRVHCFLCSFLLYFEPHEHFFSYLVNVNIAGYRAANLDLCLALTAFFNSEDYFTCHTYCDM